MRILILGGDGMLGHVFVGYLSQQHEVRCTLKQDLKNYQYSNLFSADNTYTGINMRYLEGITEVMADFSPDVVINCVGIIKQRAASKDSVLNLELNALLPHKLAILCAACHAKLVHFSTDCIFKGDKGNYKENDLSDAIDLYGKTKYLGEVDEGHCLTLRTSIIGRELTRKHGLLEWFLSQKTMVKGFKNAIFSGFTTLEMVRIVEMLLVDYPQASGIYQVSSEPINKYDLLLLFQEKLENKVDIIIDEDFCCDRSLDSSRFRAEFNYVPPSWDTMIDELK